MLNRSLQNAITERLVSLVHPKLIILFGSYARGEETFDSDLDLLIVKNSIDSRIGEKRRIRKALSGFTMPKDILVATAEEFEFYKKQAGSVIRDAVETGTILWAS